jgi:3-hydroxyisobutyrate dehydrogenase-like beta-hydroxyacid dehydrogenase
MPVAAAANEEFKESMAQGHGDADFAAVYSTISKQ